MKQTYSLTRTRKSACDPTPEVCAVAQMFGIGVDEEHEITLYKDVEVAVGTGRVVFITGESGGGKTSMLTDLCAAMAKDFHIIQANPEAPGDPSLPVINQFENLTEALELLNLAGLGEAFIMLRKPPQLSDGQRYRLALALAIAAAKRETKAPPVVVMDEFLAKLDRTTARAVAHSVRKVATVTGICFVVATTHGDVAADLNPNQTVTLELGQQPKTERRITA